MTSASGARTTIKIVVALVVSCAGAAYLQGGGGLRNPTEDVARSPTPLVAIITPAEVAATKMSEPSR